MGIPITDTLLCTLCFANGQVIVTQDCDDVNYMTRKLIDEYKTWGLEKNTNETEYMCIGGQQQDLVLNDEITIKHCYDYEYLGTNISCDGTLDEAAKDRNAARRKAITLLNSILWDQTINKPTKREYMRL